MRLYDAARVAKKQLGGSLVRSVLCIAAVAVGVAAMLLIFSAGKYGQGMLEKGISSLGVSGLSIYRENPVNTDRFNQDTAAELATKIETVSEAMAVKSSPGSLRAGAMNEHGILLGVDEKLPSLLHIELISGRLFSRKDVLNGEHTAVIDDGLARKAFGRVNVVGQKVRIAANGEERYFTVMGVIAAQSELLNMFSVGVTPNIVYVPYSRLNEGSSNADFILVQCPDERALDAAGAHAENMLERSGKIAGKIKVKNLSEIIFRVQNLAEAGTTVFVLVAAVAFLVSMFGVASGILSAVHENKPEIGVYMALGASRTDVLKIFLVQAVIIALIGSAVGSAVALIGIVGFSYMTGAAVSVSLGFTGFILILSGLCGAASGVLPALAAARLKPIDAIRS